MRKALLSIGVSDAPPLAYLPGATEAARSMVAWARASGYETLELVDDTDPVSIHDVRHALEHLLRPQNAALHRLVIHFAGHGVVRGAAEDLWLLSKWQEEQRAILAPLLRRRLERFGLKQLTIVSDARRVLPNAEAADLSQDGVLNLGPYDAEVPKLDHLQATSRFQATYMIRGAGSSQDRCLFTGVLEEALWGARPEAFASDRIPPAITSASLANFLETEVPDRAAQYGLDCVPEISTGFRAPDDVYLVSPPIGAPTSFPWPPVGAIPEPHGSLAASRDRGRGRGWSSSRAPVLEVPTGPQLRSEFGRRATVRRHASVKGADGGVPVGRKLSLSTVLKRDRRREEERRSGADSDAEHLRRKLARVANVLVKGGRQVVVAGSDVEEVWTPSGAMLVRSEGYRLWSAIPASPTGHAASSAPLLVRCGKRWVGSALVPGCQAAWLISAVGAVGHVQALGGAFGLARSQAALTALQQGGLNPDFAWDAAAALRDHKHQDLVLGVLASYLYDAVGDIESIRRIASFYVDAGQPMPFDVALLGRLACTFRNGRTTAEVPAIERRETRTKLEAERASYFRASRACVGEVAGRFPWLRQGWALLEDAPKQLCAPAIRDLAGELLPAPFTTFSLEAGLELRTILEGELN